MKTTVTDIRESTYERPKSESYIIKDKDGNKIGTTGELPSDAKQGQTSFYRTTDGMLLSSPTTAVVKLDKETGDIKITAPKGYLESDYYQKQIKPVLESYSQAYKLNPKYKMPVSSDEGAEEHDIAWYIDEFNKDLPKQIETEFYRQDESKKIGHELSYDNLRTMNTVAATYIDADGTEHKVSDSDRQALPNIEEANFLKEAIGDAWDEKTGTVDYKTLMDEGWNREKQSDEDITRLREAVNSYFDRGDFSDTDLYAQMYAFRNFMNQQDPTTGFWRGTADIVNNIGYAVLTGAADFWSGALNVFEGLMNFTGEAGTTVAKGMKTGDWNWAKEPASGEMTFWKEVSRDMDDLIKQHSSRSTGLNRGAGATYSIVNTITPFALQMVTGNGLAKLATDTLMAGVSARTAHLVAEAKNAADSLEKTAYSIYAGTNLIMDSMSTAQAAETTIAALTNLKTISQIVNSGAALAKGATITLRGAKVARWAVEMTSDAVIDCALGRPDVVRAILDGDNQEDKDLLLNELGANVIFWAGARTVGKISKVVKKTDIGRTLTAQTSVWANRMSARVGNATDKMKAWVFGDDWKENLISKRDAMARMGKSKKAQKLTQKIQTLANRENVRSQQEILGRMSVLDESGSVMENVKKIENQILNVKKAQLLWDDSNLRRATSQMFETLTNSDFDPEFKGAFDAYMNQLKEVIDAENAAGFASGLTRKASIDDVGEKGIRILDQRTINYFNAKIHLSYDREYGEVALNELNKFVKDFEDAATPELVEATNALIDRYRDVYQNLHRIGLAEDLGLNFYNSNEIAELNDARGFKDKDGFMFGENGRLYGKTMRTSDFDNWESPLSRGVAQNKSTVLSHAMNAADGTGDFVDPTYVLCTEITDRSRIAVTQGNARLLTTLPGVNTEIKVGAGATEQARLYKTDGYATAVKGQTNSLKEDVQMSGLFESTVERASAKGNKIRPNFAQSEDFTKEIDKLLSNYVEGLQKTKGGSNLFNRLSAHPGNLQDKEFQYLSLSSLSGNSADMLDDIEADAKKYYVDILSGKKGLKKSEIDEQAAALAKDFREAFKNHIDGKAADLAGELLANGSSIVDTNKLYTDISEAMLDIEGAKIATDVVKVYDVQGRETWVKMDPLIADIFNNRPIPTDMSAFQKINNLWNRTFRLGTTGANLKSFMAQNVKDFGNAWVAGGADATIKEITSHLTNELGDEIVSQIQQFEPTAYKGLQKKAAETGEDIASLAVQRELSMGRAISPSTTETEAFSFMAENRAARFGETAGDYYRTSGYQRFDDRISKLMGKMETPNAAREAYLRNLTYANGFSDAIDAGKTVKDARFSARFLMNNGTTNFGREMYHLNNLRNSVPYLGAAVNGTKSFWRLWSLDPVGVTGRIIGGIAAPVVYLTGQSLASEENRRIWKNIPEYQKDGNIVFITNGQIVSIPIPEELGGFINPIRQFVEHLNGVDPASFQELMLNDLIGLQPLNLDGFVMLDRNRLLADPTIWDRIGSMTSKFAAQIMPPAIKSAVIWVTGKDPYTGKDIPRTRTMIDPDTGEEIIMDYTSGSFAKMLGGLFGDAVSAPMAQTLLNNLIGTAGTDILNGLWGDGQKLFSGDFKGLLENPELAQNLGEQISAPFTIPQYSLANSQWQQAVSQLYAEKTAILSSEGYQSAIKGMKNATTEKEYENYKKAKQNYLDEYYAEVKATVDRLTQQYPQAFDSAKFASVISLMNMDTTTYNQTTGNYGENEYNDYLHDQLKTSGKNAAISTMAELGFTSSNANSIFGYYGTDKATGKAVIYYNDPISILNMRQAEQGADNIHYASVKSLVEKNDLWNEHSAIREQVNAIYNSKNKLSDSDYDRIDAIYVNWNARVMNVLAPYIERMTPEAAINNSKVMDYIDGLIEVPGDYKVDKRGHHVTNKSLGEGSASDAYTKNYIREIFKINDTAYAGGKNYSGRK